MLLSIHSLVDGTDYRLIEWVEEQYARGAGRTVKCAVAALFQDWRQRGHAVCCCCKHCLHFLETEKKVVLLLLELWEMMMHSPQWLCIILSLSVESVSLAGNPRKEKANTLFAINRTPHASLDCSLSEEAPIQHCRLYELYTLKSAGRWMVKSTCAWSIAIPSLALLSLFVVTRQSQCALCI